MSLMEEFKRTIADRDTRIAELEAQLRQPHPTIEDWDAAMAQIAEAQAEAERLRNKIAELQTELREAINNAAMEKEK